MNKDDWSTGTILDTILVATYNGTCRKQLVNQLFAKTMYIGKYQIRNTFSVKSEKAGPVSSYDYILSFQPVDYVILPYKPRS